MTKLAKHKRKAGPVPATAERRTVRERLLESGRVFSNSEMKVVRILLANYPAAGLTTVSRLAKSAGVSDPTVLRLGVRLGYGGFAGMQAALLAEVEAHMRSPLTLAAGEGAPKPRQRTPNAYQAFLSETLRQCEAATRNTATADYERAAALLTDSRRTVLCLGGRFSRFIAGILHRCLHHLRDGTRLLDGTAADLVDELAAIGKRHVLVVFDYRRYQVDVVTFAAQAKARGAAVILFTDEWQSPVAAMADVVLTAPTATTSPFDTLATPLIQVEAVVAGAAARLEPDWRARAETLESVRNDNHVTVENNAGRSTRAGTTRRRTDDRKR